MKPRRPTTRIFFRDDDVGELTPELRRIIELFVAERVPCNYLVVPAYLSRETADHLRPLRARHPGLIEINQHGFLHEQVIDGRHAWSEFGGRRSYSEQRAAIAEGKTILQSLFGSDFSPVVFTPPANRYDENTLHALHDLGFDVLSAIVETMPHRRAHYQLGRMLRRTWFLGGPVSYHGGSTPAFDLTELSIAVDVDLDTNVFGYKRAKTVVDILRELDRARRQHDVVGIMLHHAEYVNESKFETLKILFEELRRDPSIEIRTIESIVRVRAEEKRAAG